MKKRIIALACAMVMTVAMGMTVCAAPSVTTKSVTAEELTTGGQTLDYSDLVAFSDGVNVTSDVKATVTPVSEETAAAAIAQAKVAAGANAFVASVVDLSVPAGTGTASFTLSCPKVYAGDSVVVLHQKADGSWETITPSGVANGSVTFTLSSYSPVAIVVNATGSKTADVAGMAALMSLVGLAGAAVCGKKRA